MNTLPDVEVWGLLPSSVYIDELTEKLSIEIGQKYDFVEAVTVSVRNKKGVITAQLTYWSGSAENSSGTYDVQVLGAMERDIETMVVKALSE